MKRILFFFAAGCLGALAYSAVAWLCGDLGITRSLGVSISTAVTAHRLYPRIVWGGIWGLLFLLPLLNSRPFAKGTLLSLFPTVVQLFIVYPYQTHAGVAGLRLGMLAPMFVFLFNWAWGVVTALTIRYAK
jgi:hypothetical protein